MTSDEFITIGKRLFGRGPNGYGWQAEMHRQTGCPLRTIQAWASKDNPVLPVVGGLLRLLHAERNAKTKG